MKLSADLENAFNDQITLEIASSTVYRQLAVELALADLPGMAAWVRRQADEELVHMNKFIDHLVARGNHPKIGATPAPEVTVDSPLDAFEVALQHEQKVSESIRDLVRKAEKEGDLDSRPLLNFFLAEQVEEEDTVGEIVGRVKLTGDDGPGLLRLDAELGARPVRPTEPASNA